MSCRNISDRIVNDLADLIAVAARERRLNTAERLFEVWRRFVTDDTIARFCKEEPTTELMEASHEARNTEGGRG